MLSRWQAEDIDDEPEWDVSDIQSLEFRATSSGS
jgi:hypothetical protein